MNIYKNQLIYYFLEQNIIDKLLLILFIAIPYFYISGPFLTDVALIIIVFLFFIKIKKLDDKKNIILLFFIFLITIYLFFNHLLLNNDDKNYIKSLFYFRFLIIVPVAFLIFKKIKFVRIFFYAIMLANLIVIFDIFFQKIFGFNTIGIDAIESFNKGMHFILPIDSIGNVTRYSGFFGSELIAGGYLSRFFLINLIFLEYELKNYKIKISNIKRSFIIIVFTCIVFLGILLTGERSPLLFALLSFALYLVFYNSFKNKMIFGFITLFFIAMLMLGSANFKERFFNSTINELKIKVIEEIQLKDVYQNKHFSHYSSAIEIFKENIIFGGGFKNYRNICDGSKYECSTHPHNIFLEIISSIGIVGFILFYLFFILYYKIYLNNNKHRSTNIIYFTFVIMSFMFVLPTGSIFNNYFSLLSFYSLAALSIAIKTLKIN